MAATTPDAVYRALREEIQEAVAEAIAADRVMLVSEFTFDDALEACVQIVTGVPENTMERAGDVAMRERFEVHVCKSVLLDDGPQIDSKMVHETHGIFVSLLSDIRTTLRQNYLNDLLYIPTRLVQGSRPAEPPALSGFVRLFDTYLMDYEI